ncbi:MAG: Tab2/Atab2 family RNA-binding protein [Scytolyngbya sp. HA4215-MV1]|jgi:hypothetical protein|nr:Tab2/Atab2 family RNA-binding protein [Scytolyngbya sp. HA4215-MV1]
MGTVWELDFYSRPILDEKGKKIWELLICESPIGVTSQIDSLFRYAQYCPSTQVNSNWLKVAIAEAIAQAPHPPDKIRFFRQAMNNMIIKACDEVGISAQLSLRTFALNLWLQQRMQEVYPEHPGYQPGVAAAVAFAPTNPQPLPDALIGEKWQFVTLEASTLAEMDDWEIDFGEAFPLNLAQLEPTMPVPGLLIFSSRAKALAAWMSGLELACVKFEREPTARLLLETGIDDRWILAPLSTTQTQAEAEGFEATKQKARRIHFLAVQSNPQSETFAGFWLLQEVTN